MEKRPTKTSFHGRWFSSTKRTTATITSSSAVRPGCALKRLLRKAAQRLAKPGCSRNSGTRCTAVPASACPDSTHQYGTSSTVPTRRMHWKLVSWARTGRETRANRAASRRT